MERNVLKMNELFSIGDISKIFHIPIKTLRYYDEIGLLVPAFVDTNTKYRFYSVDQFVLIDIIRNSKKMGMPLSEVKKAIEEDLKFNDILELIDRQSICLDEKINELNMLKASMNTIRESLGEISSLVFNEVFLVKEDIQKYISFPYTSRTIEEQEINFRKAALSSKIIEREVYAVFGVGTDAKLYFDKGEMVNPDIRYYIKNRLSPAEYEKIPAGMYACIIFDDNSFAKEKYYGLLAEYLTKNRIQAQGDFIEQWIMPRVEGKRESTLIKLEIKIED